MRLRIQKIDIGYTIGQTDRPQKIYFSRKGTVIAAIGKLRKCGVVSVITERGVEGYFVNHRMAVNLAMRFDRATIGGVT